MLLTLNRLHFSWSYWLPKLLLLPYTCDGIKDMHKNQNGKAKRNMSLRYTYAYAYVEGILLLRALVAWMHPGGTVPLKCKLTVSTRNSILDPRSFRESSFEARVSSFDFRGSRTKFRGWSFEFWDTRRIFLVFRTEISKKQFNSWKQNHSDEQNNWRAALFVQTCCWMYATIFFVLCTFYKTHAVRLSTLKLMFKAN